jgi:arabinan endo-1,5-alpha-L-arabinosidase
MFKKSTCDREVSHEAYSTSNLERWRKFRCSCSFDYTALLIFYHRSTFLALTTGLFEHILYKQYTEDKNGIQDMDGHADANGGIMLNDRIAVRRWLAAACIALMMAGCSNDAQQEDGMTETPVFGDVTVHDPSIMKAGDTYYVFGSHLASAKSTDLMNWTQVSNVVNADNVLIPDALNELKETFEWAETGTLWAADVIQLADGKFYMYYNACRGDSPRSALGVAVSDSAEGPYQDLGILLRSGMGVGELLPNESYYDATVHPNVVDPDVFFDKDGKLWMVYGSYSGGIYILEMDAETGMPLPDQGYGKKLLGGNHARIEGPYMLYSPDTDYYYLFLSYGGLDSYGGYNMRVARSKNPDGPFQDSQGQDMADAMGAPGTLFDDRSIEGYGTKLMGNFQWMGADGEPGPGYVSPGHNSAYHDEETGQYYLIFHTRFPNTGEIHSVRVHQMFMNEDGWPVAAPHRYAGEKLAKYDKKQIAGSYMLVDHGREISNEIKPSSAITLEPDGSITGTVTGSWELTDGNQATVTVDGIAYSGVFIRQWDASAQRKVMAFTVLSADGTALWGTKPAAD